MRDLLDKEVGKTGKGKGVAVALKKKIFEDTGASNLGSKQSLLKVNYMIRPYMIPWPCQIDFCQ